MVGRVREKFEMTYSTMHVSSMKYAKNQSKALLKLGSFMGMGMAPEVHPDGWMGQEKV